MAAISPLLEFNCVTFSIDEVSILSEVSFTLESGQLLFVTGASGSGKSVLLRLALGLLKPDSGKVMLRGVDIGQLSEDDLLKLRGREIGMVFQEQAAFSGLSVLENTAFSLLEHGWKRDSAEAEAFKMLRFVGLEKDYEKLPEELSGGMERRLEVARSLIGWPPIMLYDEPVNGLDPINSIQVLNLIIYANDIKGVSTVYVTKNMREIQLLANTKAYVLAGSDKWEVRDTAEPLKNAKVLLLEDGQVLFAGSPTELFTSRLPAAVRLTEADNGTVLSDFYTPDPWDKARQSKLTSNF